MPGLSVVSAPANMPVFSPTVQSAPVNQPALTPRVLPAPQNAPVLAPKVQSQPVNQPALNPAVQGQPQAQPAITSVGTADAQQPYQAKLSVDDFANLIKQKFPQYADQDNTTLTKAILDKHPEYADRVYVPVSDAPQYSVGGFAGNVLKSGATAVKNLVTAVLHPVDTIEGAAKIFYGALDKSGALPAVTSIVPGLSAANAAVTPEFKQQSSDALDKTVEFFKQRYGSIDNLKKTAYNDPVGFLIDLSAVLDAGGSALTKVGDISEISTLTKAGEIASKAGEAANPITIAGKATKLGLSKAGDVASETLGTFTGAGGGAVTEAFSNPSPEFRSALRGNTSPGEIVDNAKQALSTVKADRAASYQSDLAKIKIAPGQLDIAPLKTELSKQLSKFAVEVDEKGSLNFDNSTISDPAEQAKVQSAFDDINRWDKNPKNITPIGVDTLKRRLDNLYSPNSDVRAFTNSLKTTARQILNDKVPGYAEMTSAYQKATGFIDDVTKGLSLGDKASTDTALRKLASTLKQNNEFRTELVRQLQDAAGKDITGQIAGYNLSSILPRTIVGKGADLLALYGLAHAISPATLAALAASSPRLIGEIVGGLGVASGKVSKVVDALKNAGTPNLVAPAYQLGRLKNQSR